ncbi:MAG: Nif3-like dinuclear metal center hexameric protein [Gammaproteobacteria bacterium]|jgi:dinuclear metal center YbgI/SA1388 family protein|nr:Nif3-like dinuclear metal center hexameric protein [Gammaproteobacteria bacterium]
MAALRDITALLDDLLAPDRYTDYAPNGLQVEGAATVTRMLGGVTANLALIEAAIAAEAEAILVHHGWFWKSEDPRVLGIKRRRLELLLRHDISLIAYHLPLDAHPELGNNAGLGRVLGLEPGVTVAGLPELVMCGRLPTPLPAADFAALISRRLGREPLHVGSGPARIHRIAWCTGAAQDYIEDAARAGFDAYLSGEISERTTHIAREAGIHYYAAGHHATERYGVQAVGEHLARSLDIDFRFVDVDNPV